MINKIKILYYKIANPIGREIINKKLTYLPLGALYNIHDTIVSIEKKKIEGIFVETGCALGGSTIQIGKSKNPNRVLKVYDVFGMIPSPSDKDGKDVVERYSVIKNGFSDGIKGDTYYGYQENLLQKVKQTLFSFGLTEKDNIHLIKGLYEDTLKVTEAIAFAHIDCDWYESVMTCLVQIVPHLSFGGVIIIDDYYDWSSCREAVDDYFRDFKGDKKFSFAKRNGKLIVNRNK